MASSVYLTNPFGGGGGTPGGSDTQIQYNNAGAFGGVTGFTWNGSALAVPGPATLTSAVGSSALTITGGTQTASFPALSLTQTWNNGAVTFTGVLVDVTNTASASASTLLDLQVASAPKWQVTTDGSVVSAINAKWSNRNGATLYPNTYILLAGHSNTIQLFTDSTSATTSRLVMTSSTTQLSGTVEVRGSTTAQTFRVYETYTDASNYERGSIAAASDALTIAYESAGTGTANGSIVLTPKGTGIVSSAASVRAHSGTAIPAGGTAGAGLLVSSTSNYGVFFGSGAPSLSAAQGSLYLRSDGSSTSTRAYINTDGGATWTAITTAA